MQERGAAGGKATQMLNAIESTYNDLENLVITAHAVCTCAMSQIRGARSANGQYPSPCLTLALLDSLEAVLAEADDAAVRVGKAIAAARIALEEPARQG